MITLSLTDPIVPNSSLGGLQVHGRLAELAAINGCPKSRLVSPSEVVYEVCDGAVLACVDVTTGRFTGLSAYTGYVGKLWDRIAVGMLVSDAVALEPGFVYCEVKGLIFHPSRPGVSLSLNEADPLIEALPDLVITEITVFDSTVNGTGPVDPVEIPREAR